MKAQVLTQMKARSLPPGKHADGQGLWLVKREKECGKWMLRLVVHGHRREMGLGRWPDVSIAEARGMAEQQRRTLRLGTDPIFERVRVRRAGKPLTLKEAIDGCFEARRAELKGDGEAGRWMSPLSVHIIPKYGSYPIEQMDQHVLKEALSPIWNVKPEAAAKALNRMSLTFKHAAALGLAVDLQATMKTRALLGKQRRTTEHIPSLAYEHAPDFYKWLQAVEGVSALALRFVILTLARTTEVRMMTFSEIEGNAWHLPAKRTKTNAARRIPLVPEAQKVVALCREASSNEYLFPAYKGKPISDAAMSTLMKRNGYVARPHGFRSTFRTWVEEQTDAEFAVKESVLGHIVDTETVGAYQRSDRYEKRTKLMVKWEGLLLAESVASIANARC